jgi:hypothetical protein
MAGAGEVGVRCFARILRTLIKAALVARVGARLRGTNAIVFVFVKAFDVPRLRARRPPFIGRHHGFRRASGAQSGRNKAYRHDTMLTRRPSSAPLRRQRLQ